MAVLTVEQPIANNTQAGDTLCEQFFVAALDILEGDVVPVVDSNVRLQDLHALERYVLANHSVQSILPDSAAGDTQQQIAVQVHRHVFVLTDLLVIAWKQILQIGVQVSVQTNAVESVFIHLTTLY